MTAKIAQIALRFGADDIDGTVVEEKIYHDAGATTPQGMRREELEGRKGRQPDGSSKTREAKLGCIVTERVPSICAHLGDTLLGSSRVRTGSGGVSAEPITSGTPIT